MRCSGAPFALLACSCVLGLASTPRLTFTDTVLRIQEQEGLFKVSFRQHAAIYKLSKERKDWDASFAALLWSRDARSEVVVEVDPFALTILKAKGAPPRP